VSSKDEAQRFDLLCLGCAAGKDTQANCVGASTRERGTRVASEPAQSEGMPHMPIAADARATRTVLTTHKETR
jgi:hypothetical protein